MSNKYVDEILQNVITRIEGTLGYCVVDWHKLEQTSREQIRQAQLDAIGRCMGELSEAHDNQFDSYTYRKALGIMSKQINKLKEELEKK